jgi:hypothetical protein
MINNGILTVVPIGAFQALGSGSIPDRCIYVFVFVALGIDEVRVW